MLKYPLSSWGHWPVCDRSKHSRITKWIRRFGEVNNLGKERDWRVEVNDLGIWRSKKGGRDHSLEDGLGEQAHYLDTKTERDSVKRSIRRLPGHSLRYSWKMEKYASFVSRSITCDRIWNSFWPRYKKCGNRRWFPQRVSKYCRKIDGRRKGLLKKIWVRCHFCRRIFQKRIDLWI